MANYFKVDRKIVNWRYFKRHNYLCVWIYLLSRANYKDGYSMGYIVHAGQTFETYRSISEKVNIPINTLRNILRNMQMDRQVNIQPNSQGMIISIVNWREYQHDEKKSEQSSEQTSEQSSEQTSEQSSEQSSEQQSITYNALKHIELKQNNKRESLSPQFLIPSETEIKTYIKDQNLNVDPDVFCSYYNSNGWMVGKNKMKDWKETLKTWSAREKMKPHKHVDLLPKYMTDPESIPAEAELTGEEINEIKKLQQSMSRKNERG